MATGGGDPVSLVDIVICDICFEVMVKPQALNCLHHFCHTCTSRLFRVKVRRRKGVECPFCKRFTPEHEIQDSFMMNNLLDIYQRKESQETHADNKQGKLCLQCGSLEVSFYCKNCEIELCESCKDSHLRIPAFKSHTVIVLSDIKHDKIRKVERFCKLHPGYEIKYSCVPCKSVICAECKVESHDTHPTESVEKALKAILGQARGHIEAIHENKSKVKHQLEKLHSLKALYESEYEERSNEIDNHKSNIIAKVEADCNELQECLKAKKTATITDIDIDVADAEKQLSTMESLLTCSGAIISTTEGPGPLCELRGGLLNKLEAAVCNIKTDCKEEKATCQFRPIRIKFENNYVGTLIQEVERLSSDAALRPCVQQKTLLSSTKQLKSSRTNDDEASKEYSGDDDNSSHSVEGGRGDFRSRGGIGGIKVQANESHGFRGGFCGRGGFGGFGDRGRNRVQANESVDEYSSHGFRGGFGGRGRNRVQANESVDEYSSHGFRGRFGGRGRDRVQANESVDDDSNPSFREGFGGFRSGGGRGGNRVQANETVDDDSFHNVRRGRGGFRSGGGKAGNRVQANESVDEYSSHGFRGGFSSFRSGRGRGGNRVQANQSVENWLGQGWKLVEENDSDDDDSFYM